MWKIIGCFDSKARRSSGNDDGVSEVSEAIDDSSEGGGDGADAVASIEAEHGSSWDVEVDADVFFDDFFFFDITEIRGPRGETW
jgi:hypothetical protein